MKLIGFKEYEKRAFLFIGALTFIYLAWVFVCLDFAAPFRDSGSRFFVVTWFFFCAVMAATCPCIEKD